MKHISTILLLLTVTLAYGQYTLDETIKNHLFLRKVYPEFNDNKCSLSNSYYEPQDLHHLNCSDPMHQKSMFNGASIECYLLQEQLKDTLRQQFTDSELFDIVQFSKIPFYRIAAFELYTQTDYPKDKVIDFLKRGKVSMFQVYDPSQKDSIPEKYMPMPNSLHPSVHIIRLKMLDFINPGARRMVRKDTLNSYEMIEVPMYSNCQPLDLETFISLTAYLNNYCIESIGYTTIGRLPSFTLSHTNYNFGKINLRYIDNTSGQFTLIGYIKVTNASDKTIYISPQASSLTKFLKSTYTINPKKEILIKFSSSVDLEHFEPSIERSITLKNSKTGEVLDFTFNAQFINK